MKSEELIADYCFDATDNQTKAVYPKADVDVAIAELKAENESLEEKNREYKAREDVLVTDNRDLLEKVKMLENQLRENAEHFKRNELQILENADKVIAEKDKEIQRLENLCVSYRIDCDNLAISNEHVKRAARTLLKKMNHNKRKRCLAMARICYMKSWSCIQYISPREKYDHWKKWQKRWTELANKFKEAQ